MMEIEIVYQTWESDQPARLKLSPEAYFDPLEPGDTYQENGIPRYNETWQYLDVPRSRLKWACERRSGTWFDTTFLTQYLDSGRSWLTHRVDPDGYEEMIHVTQLDDSTCHIIRTVKPAAAARWAVCLNSVIHDQDDGSQKEQRFDEPWTREGIERYCRLPREGHRPPEP
jgi:hypothetical protein